MQVVVALLKPRGMPCRIPSMSRSSPSRMDAWKRRWIASGACCFGLVAQTVCCRDRPARLRGRDPPEAWVASCRTVAGSLRCPCGTGEPCGRPVVAAFGRQVPVANGESGMASRRCASRVSPVRALRGCLRAGGRRRPRYASCHMHLPRLHAPEPRTRPRFRRRCASPLVQLGPVGPTLPLAVERTWWCGNYRGNRRRLATPGRWCG